MRAKLKLLILFLSISVVSFAQSTGSAQKATLIVPASKMTVVPSIASQIANGTFIPGQDLKKEMNPKRQDANRTIPGKGLPHGNDPLWEKQIKATKIKGKDPIITFEVASAWATPTDPTGAVGPNHYVNAWNSSFRIWDKEGNPLTSPAALGTILNGNAGDPIVMYDQFADRFIITQFYHNGFGMAICQGSDPVNDGWYSYNFNTNKFPDYPKFSVWSDGYYITANKDSNTAGSSEVVFAVDRDKMLTGDQSALMVGFPLPGIRTSGFYSPLSFNANGTEMPPLGNSPIVYQQDDAWYGVNNDHLKIWNINMDWATPSNSEISEAQILDTEDFDGVFDGGSFSNLPQPSGGDIDALQATVMYMAQYRRFTDHNSVVFNFVVDLDGADNHAGIRWYELRQPADGEPWAIYQEGTYAQPDGHSAFCGTMAQDVHGNIALAYTTVSNTKYPSIKYTGRMANDPIGTMTIEEGTIVDGTQSDPATRYGDYAQMTIDPTDDETFWSVSEYFNGGRKNIVGAFKLAGEATLDAGVVSIDSPVDGSLTAEESVTISIRNYGTDAQTNIPVNYQIDGGELVSEVFTGSIEPNATAQYTFTTTGDFSAVGTTYEITAFTQLEGDANNTNDTITTSVTHLYTNDIGIATIDAPVSSSDLSDEEAITITIENFGSDEHSNFDVSYVLDEGAPVTEQVEGPLAGNTSIAYTFQQTGNFQAIGEYQLTVKTLLPGDVDTSNDELSVAISNDMCLPQSDCSEGDGIATLQLTDINNNSNCDPNGYGDYTDLVGDISRGDVHQLSITTGYGNQYIKAWVDMNDNFLFEADEVVVNNFLMAEGQAAGNYTESMDFSIPATTTLGEHMLRVRAKRDAEIEGPCEEVTYGETEDYTINATIGAGIENQLTEPNDLVISTLGNNQFRVSFDAVNLNETLIVTLHDMMGHMLIRNRVNNNNGHYEYEFDMSYATPGVYLLRLGSANFGKVKRIVVK